MTFGVNIIIEIFVDVEMIWLDSEYYGSLRRFLEIPELKTAHFVDNDVGCLEVVEDVDRRFADIAD